MNAVIAIYIMAAALTTMSGIARFVIEYTSDSPDPAEIRISARMFLLGWAWPVLIVPLVGPAARYAFGKTRHMPEQQKDA